MFHDVEMACDISRDAMSIKEETVATLLEPFDLLHVLDQFNQSVTLVFELQCNDFRKFTIRNPHPYLPLCLR